MPKTTERIWMKITLRDNHDIQTTYEVQIFQYSLRGLLWPSYIIGQLTGSVFNTGKKGSKQLFYTVLLDTTLLDINHTAPDILTTEGSDGVQY